MKPRCHGVSRIECIPTRGKSWLSCSRRLDFDQFNIQGPESMNHVCSNDQFIVSGGNPVPAICGVNTGNHSEFGLRCLRPSAPGGCSGLGLGVQTTSLEMDAVRDRAAAWLGRAGRRARRRPEPRARKD